MGGRAAGDGEPFEAELVRMATAAAEFDRAVHPLAEVKAHEAFLAEWLDVFDELHGAAATTYSGFRDAVDDGASCSELVALRDTMRADDTLRAAADEDLRSLGCPVQAPGRRDPGPPG